MKRLIPTILILILMSAPVYSDEFQDIQDGIDAYELKDYKTALGKLKPLAEKGHSKAQFILGMLFAEGQGVLQNYVQAHKWFNLSADGIKEGGEWRESLSKIMTSAQIAEAQNLAKDWMEKQGKKMTIKEVGQSYMDRFDDWLGVMKPWFLDGYKKYMDGRYLDLTIKQAMVALILFPIGILVLIVISGRLILAGGDRIENLITSKKWFKSKKEEAKQDNSDSQSK